MFKLITKRGIIQNHVKTKNLPVDFKIDTLNVECRWGFKNDDLEKNDDVIVVGYIGNDEYDDSILYVCAYFNTSKSKKSMTKQRTFYSLISSIALILLTAVYWKSIINHYPWVLPISLLAIFTAFFLLHNLMAYRILEKEIKKSYLTPPR